MSKHHGTPILYDYWIDYDKLLIYAILEWAEEKETPKKSNLFLITEKYHGY